MEIDLSSRDNITLTESKHSFKGSPDIYRGELILAGDFVKCNLRRQIYNADKSEIGGEEQKILLIYKFTTHFNPGSHSCNTKLKKIYEINLESMGCGYRLLIKNIKCLQNGEPIVLLTGTGSDNKCKSQLVLLDHKVDLTDCSDFHPLNNFPEDVVDAISIIHKLSELPRDLANIVVTYDS